mgnify:FL=1
MQALVIVAHGSRREASNQEIRALAQQVQQLGQHPYAWVSCAFLELAEPSIPDGIQQAIEQGASNITIMPFFLSAGRHTVEDVPALVRAKQAEYPQIPMRLAPYLGVSPLMPMLIANAAQAACQQCGETCRYPDCLRPETITE